eukprot:TRINITY_DN20322_c0_g1_i1.p1 TRINITY_DN20322_c0_g1~~TRINITY_DN20322_c0_g1_i1.p1  ORF type:complete len:621 (+),score=159.57 TRINITY_DN20322_c0_g1_i1:69-1865(+)
MMRDVCCREEPWQREVDVIRSLVGSDFRQRHRTWPGVKRGKEVDHATGQRSVLLRWENRSAEGPQPCPRSGHSITVLEPEGLAILFGGMGDDLQEGDPLYSDVWICNLHQSTWREVSTRGAPPPCVFGHVAEIVNPDPDNLCLLVFGGQGSGGSLSDSTFILADVLHDPVWRKVPDMHCQRCYSPLRRWGHTIAPLYEAPGEVSSITRAAVPPGGNLQLIVFGGMTEEQESLSDMIAFDVSELCWRDVPLAQGGGGGATEGGLPSVPRRPMGRRRHVAAMDAEKSLLWIFGGRSEWNHFLSDLWCFNIKARTWLQVVRPGNPKPRTGHCGVLHGTYFYVFGGFELIPTPTEWMYNLHNDLHRFDIEGLVWEEVMPDDAVNAGPCITGPPSTAPVCTHELRPHACAELGSGMCRVPRQRSMAACYVVCDRLFIHGGRDKERAFHCAFSVPLPPPKHRSLTEQAAQFIVSKGIPYTDAHLPPALLSLLDSMFVPPEPLRETASGDASATSSSSSLLSMCEGRLRRTSDTASTDLIPEVFASPQEMVLVEEEGEGDTDEGVLMAAMEDPAVFHPGAMGEAHASLVWQVEEQSSLASSMAGT